MQASWTLATMESVVKLGMFIAFAVIAAFLADVLVALALMVLFQRRMAAARTFEGRARKKPRGHPRGLSLPTGLIPAFS
jgi:hypothetical protein